MIKSKKQLKEILEEERNLYLTQSKGKQLRLRMLSDHDYLIWTYIKALRYTEYHCNVGHKIRYWLWERRKNRLGAYLGITMWHNTIGKGMRLWHYGNITINGSAKIGVNCQLHGDNCIGNKGARDNKAPVLGDNVELGVGSKIIGDIYIANNITIGANAVVTKSCYKEGATLVGVPAREI